MCRNPWAPLVLIVSPGAYTSGVSLFSSMVLYRLDREPGWGWGEVQGGREDSKDGVAHGGDLMAGILKERCAEKQLRPGGEFGTAVSGSPAHGKATKAGL